MEHHVSGSSKIKLFFTQFLLPSPIELVPYFFTSLLILLVAANQTLLVILADGSPVTPIPINEVFSQRFDYIAVLLSVPILGRIVLFLFWLAIGSVVYMLVWLFQNLAIEVYDDLTYAKLKNPKDREDEDGWWGTTLSHAIFVGSSVLFFLFYIVIAINFLFPAWIQLFQIGLQGVSEVTNIFEVVIAVIGTMITLHIFVLFWKLFMRLRGYIYNNLY